MLFVAISFKFCAPEYGFVNLRHWHKHDSQINVVNHYVPVFMSSLNPQQKFGSHCLIYARRHKTAGAVLSVKTYQQLRNAGVRCAS